MNNLPQEEILGTISPSELRSGPVTNRKCTDMSTLMMFLSIFGFTIYICAFSYSKGQPSQLAVPYDSDHMACG